MDERGVSAFIAEFIGTFFLVLFICMAVSVTAPTGLTVPALLTIALTHGDRPRDGHTRRAGRDVRRALQSRRHDDVDGAAQDLAANAAIYILLQFAAAVSAALVCKLLIGNFGKAANYGAPGLSAIANGKGGGFLAELIGVFVLLWAIMAMAVNVRAPKGWAGLIIGLTLGLGVLGFGALTGAALNPARAFGPALVSGAFGPAGTWLLVYVLAPLVGGVLAGVGYTKLVLDEQERRWGGRLLDTDVPPERLPDGIAAAESGPGERPIDKLS